MVYVLNKRLKLVPDIMDVIAGFQPKYDYCLWRQQISNAVEEYNLLHDDLKVDLGSLDFIFLLALHSSSSYCRPGYSYSACRAVNIMLRQLQLVTQPLPNWD